MKMSGRGSRRSESVSLCSMPSPSWQFKRNPEILNHLRVKLGKHWQKFDLLAFSFVVEPQLTIHRGEICSVRLFSVSVSDGVGWGGVEWGGVGTHQLALSYIRHVTLLHLRHAVERPLELASTL